MVASNWSLFGVPMEVSSISRPAISSASTAISTTATVGSSDEQPLSYHAFHHNATYTLSQNSETFALNNDSNLTPELSDSQHTLEYYAMFDESFINLNTRSLDIDFRAPYPSHAGVLRAPRPQPRSVNPMMSQSADLHHNHDLSVNILHHRAEGQRNLHLSMMTTSKGIPSQPIQMAHPV
jgi:hypothetical protein